MTLAKRLPRVRTRRNCVWFRRRAWRTHAGPAGTDRACASSDPKGARPVRVPRPVCPHRCGAWSPSATADPRHAPSRGQSSRPRRCSRRYAGCSSHPDRPSLERPRPTSSRRPAAGAAAVNSKTATMDIAASATKAAAATHFHARVMAVSAANAVPSASAISIRLGLPYTVGHYQARPERPAVGQSRYPSLAGITKGRQRRMSTIDESYVRPGSRGFDKSVHGRCARLDWSRSTGSAGAG